MTKFARANLFKILLVKNAEDVRRKGTWERCSELSVPFLFIVASQKRGRLFSETHRSHHRLESRRVTEVEDTFWLFIRGFFLLQISAAQYQKHMFIKFYIYKSSEHYTHSYDENEISF